MAGPYRASIKVISQKGTCANEHKVGDQWIVDKKTPEGLCLSACNSLLPRLTVLIFGGAFPWEDDPDMTTIACPDAANPVVFELRRLHD